MVRDALNQMANAPHERDSVVRALSTLALSGVIKAQIQLDFAAMMEGSDIEDSNQLAERITQFRKKSHLLQELHDLGVQLNEEMTRAQRL